MTEDAPERIYDWLESQLSVARFYGGCTYPGHKYIVDMTTLDVPLVRADVLTAEKKAEIQLKRDLAQADAVRALMAQGSLI